MRQLAVTSFTAIAFGLLSLPGLAADYSFTVANNADQKIVKIEVSEDGKSWGPFDIGSGIPSGESAQLNWAESTNNSGCEWMFRATFSGGDVLDSDYVDFCEDDVVISFDFAE